MKLKEVLNLIFYLFLIVFSIFTIYQILRKLLGGSWETQDIMIALLILILGFVFNLTVKLTKLETKFSYLAKDFKQHLAK
jgi:uncharacterized integral membrane protein